MIDLRCLDQAHSVPIVAARSKFRRAERSTAPNSVARGVARQKFAQSMFQVL